MPSKPDVSKAVPASAEAILESISDAFFSLDPDWNFGYLNGRARQLLACDDDNAIGKNVWDLFPGLVGSRFEALYREVASERVPGSLTAFYPDHERWYEVNAYPFEQGITVYFRDVSERVKAEEQLRESELRFRLMANSIPQIVWIVDEHGQGIFFNQQWADYTGHPIGATHPETVSQDFVHPDDHAPTMAAWGQAHREGRVFSVEHRIRSASGAYRWFLVRAEPYRDPQTGKIVRWFGTSTDVHDRKMAEAAMRRSEARYRSLFDSIDEGFCIFEMIYDENGRPCDYRFCEVNPTFAQQTGLHDAAGRTIRELVPAHEQHWFDIYGNVAVTGEPIRFEREAKALGRWFDLYAFRIDDPGMHRVAVLFKDITERRRIEQELRDAGRRKDEFLAMLAHELRNPLAPISAAADLLRMAQLDEKRVRYTSEIISRQVRHMTSLVDDLLDVSRVTRGLVELEPVVLEVRRILADAVEQVRPLIEARSQHFTLHAPPAAVFVRGDQKRLVQVVANLLGNSAKYTPEGGRIELRMEVRDDQVVLTVEDNGIGMTPELRSRVFELFAQAERNADRAQGGLGIGLALVKSLVELHHGQVSADSAGLGQGSRFTVVLPRLPGQDQAAEPGQELPLAASSASLRILIVEDNVDAASMLALFLEAAGHRVRIEHSSVRALERARSEQPDVCLLDIGLPDMDGYELARRLRSQPETADTVLIAITGYGQDAARAESAGDFDHRFVKPVDIGKLAAMLEKVASSHREKDGGQGAGRPLWGEDPNPGV